MGRAPTPPEVIAFIVEQLKAGRTPVEVQAATAAITHNRKPVSLPIIYREAAKLGLKLQRGGARANSGGARPNTGGIRPGAGRPKGSKSSPHHERVLLLAAQGMSKTAIAAEVGITRQAVSAMISRELSDEDE